MAIMPNKRKIISDILRRMTSSEAVEVITKKGQCLELVELNKGDFEVDVLMPTKSGTFNQVTISISHVKKVVC